MNSNAPTLDSSAIGLSTLCLVHCLALPILGASLPLAGVLAEAEWIHQILALIAIPITLVAIARHHASKVKLSFVAPALLGLSLLLAAGFVEALHDYETLLTVTGAALLTSAHIWRWVNRHASSA